LLGSLTVEDMVQVSTQSHEKLSGAHLCGRSSGTAMLNGRQRWSSLRRAAHNCASWTTLLYVVLSGVKLLNAAPRGRRVRPVTRAGEGEHHAARPLADEST